jgi:hypothetical protein
LTVYQPGQKGHGGQLYFFCGVLTIDFTLAEGQQVSSGQHSNPSEQRAVFAAVLAGVSTLAVDRQFGGHSSEQPGGQVGSRQQSSAWLAAVAALAV